MHSYGLLYWESGRSQYLLSVCLSPLFDDGQKIIIKDTNAFGQEHAAIVLDMSPLIIEKNVEMVAIS